MCGSGAAKLQRSSKGTQADGICPCQWEHPQATGDGGELGTTDLSPHLRPRCWLLLHLLPQCCCCRALCHQLQPALPRFSSQTNALGVVCGSVPSLSHPVLLLAIVAVWHVSSVGVTVCRWPCLGVWCGGQEPVANGTYCCIAGARLSGSLPAV